MYGIGRCRAIDSLGTRYYIRYHIPQSAQPTMIELKVRKFGNSLGVILPKDVLTRLRSTEGERLFLVEEPRGEYRLTPYDPEFAAKMSAADDLMHRYRNTLRELAK